MKLVHESAMNGKSLAVMEGRRMDDATGEAQGAELRVAFDRRLKLKFHGARVLPDAEVTLPARSFGASSTGCRAAPARPGLC
jgi:hypothetical protein